MDKSTLAKINSFTRRKFTEEELYVFPITLCDNDIDRDNERFSDNALEKLKELFVGKTGIFDHNTTADNQTARVFDTEIVTDEERRTKYGAPYKYLKAMAYMIRTDSNRDIIAEIDGGIKKEVSVSCSAAKRICSVCGCDRSKENCTHKKGEDYFGQQCHVILDGITDAYEWSFVAVPAQINAGVTKKYNNSKEEETMDFTPINTQAEFDAAVQSRIDAAVADTEKRFEGWVSPEDAAKLTKERDDLTAANKAYAITAMKMKAANEKGIPLELAEKLSGETEEDINKDAESFAKYFNVQKCKPTPRYSGENGAVDANTAAQLEMLRELKN